MKLKEIFHPVFYFFVSVLIGMARIKAAEDASLNVGLCDYQLIDGKVNYCMGHVSSLSPEDLTNLIRKGCSRLSAVIAGSNDADVHSLEIFNVYDNHNPYYIKNGITPTNLIDAVKTSIGISDVHDLSAPARVESFVSLVWGLVSLSWQRGDKFNRGAIIIEDKDRRIHDYLEKIVLYIAQVQQPKDLNDAIYTIWGSNIGYQRLGKSSHFVDRQITHYGFDSRFNPNSFALPVLPFAMSHVLFGRCLTHSGKEVTFIKPEEAGLADLRSLFQHLYCLFAPVPVSNLLRREKDVSSNIADNLYQLIQLMFDECKDILCVEMQSIHRLAEVGRLKGIHFQNTKKYDLSWWVDKLAMLKSNSKCPEKVLSQIKLVEDLLQQTYRKDSLHLRSGNEVLFLDEELRQENSNNAELK